jgi:hypothetical protein
MRAANVSAPFLLSLQRRPLFSETLAFPSLALLACYAGALARERISQMFSIFMHLPNLVQLHLNCAPKSMIEEREIADARERHPDRGKKYVNRLQYLDSAMSTVQPSSFT